MWLEKVNKKITVDVLVLAWAAVLLTNLIFVVVFVLVSLLHAHIVATCPRPRVHSDACRGCYGASLLFPILAQHLDMDELPVEGAGDADDADSSAPSSAAASEKPKSAKKQSKAEKAAAEKEAQKAKAAAKATPAPSLLTIGRATAKKPEDDKKAAAAEAAAASSAPAAVGKGAALPSQKAPLLGQNSKASLPSSAASAPPGMASLASILKGGEQPTPTQQQQQQKQAEQQRQQQAASAAQKQQQQQQLLQQQQQQQQQRQQAAAASAKGGSGAGGASANSMAGLMASLGAAPATASSVAQALAGDANTMSLPLPLSSATGVAGGPSSSSSSGGGPVLNLVGPSSHKDGGAPKGSQHGGDEGSKAGDGGPFGAAGPGGSSGSDDGSSAFGSATSSSAGGGSASTGFVRQDAAGLANSLAALAQSLQCVPAARDRASDYAPRNPHPTPAAFFCAPGPGGGPSPVFDDPVVFEKFHTDTLFFIFYYQPGTYQQYLAARELKKQSWRFHKKYKTWFQRHEEPTVTTDEYEQGTYVYFDYQGTYESKSGWCQRIKYDFTFEYEFLEDEL